MAYLDKAGLTYFWNKIKVLLTNKSDKGHTHTLDDVSETASKKIMTSAERTKLSGIATGANNYSHPASHPASMITGLSKVATTGSYNDLSNKPTILQQSTNGFNGAIVAGSDGVAEYGKYCDFHNTKETTSDYSTRLVCTGDYKNTVNLPSVDGTLVVGDKGYKIVVSSTAPTVDDKNVITIVI